MTAWFTAVFAFTNSPKLPEFGAVCDITLGSRRVSRWWDCTRGHVRGDSVMQGMSVMSQCCSDWR